LGALAHHYEIKRGRFQALNAGFKGRASGNFASLSFQNQTKASQIVCFLIDKKDLGAMSGKINLWLYECVG
jgi:hypothetical protein